MSGAMATRAQKAKETFDHVTQNILALQADDLIMAAFAHEDIKDLPAILSLSDIDRNTMTTDGSTKLKMVLPNCFDRLESRPSY